MFRIDIEWCRHWDSRTCNKHPMTHQNNSCNLQAVLQRHMWRYYLSRRNGSHLPGQIYTSCRSPTRCRIRLIEHLPQCLTATKLYLMRAKKVQNVTRTLGITQINIYSAMSMSIPVKNEFAMSPHGFSTWDPLEVRGSQDDASTEDARFCIETIKCINHASPLFRYKYHEHTCP